MPLTAIDTDALADRLDLAQRTTAPIESLADDHNITVDEAYRIQNAVISRRLGRGEQLTGAKLGFTSKAKMAQMGVSEVIAGQLTDAMYYADGSVLDLSRFIHPKVEPEVAYRLRRGVDLADPATDIESCVEAVAPAMEIIDSRYRNFRFTVTDVIADNTSAAAYVIGPWRSPCDLTDRAVQLDVGETTEVGSTAAILGDPMRSLHALVTLARRRDIAIAPGSVVLAGAATAATQFIEGFAVCDVAGLGRVSLRGAR